MARPQSCEESRRYHRATPTFQVFFLKDNEPQSVEVLEVEDLNLLEFKMRILQGNSIFITLKQEEKFKGKIMDDKMTEMPWYFYRM